MTPPTKSPAEEAERLALEPCPFCGNVRPAIGIVHGFGNKLGEKFPVCRVECSCGAHGPTVSREAARADDASACWNTRSTAPRPGQGDGMREALAQQVERASEVLLVTPGCDEDGEYETTDRLDIDARYLLAACNAALASPPPSGERALPEVKGEETLWGQIAAVYGELDVEDCKHVDREWAKMRGYILPTDGKSTLIEESDKAFAFFKTDVNGRPTQFVTSAFEAAVWRAQSFLVTPVYLAPNPPGADVVFSEEDWPAKDQALAAWFNALRSRPGETDWDALMEILQSHANPPSDERAKVVEEPQDD